MLFDVVGCLKSVVGCCWVFKECCLMLLGVVGCSLVWRRVFNVVVRCLKSVVGCCWVFVVVVGV